MSDLNQFNLFNFFKRYKWTKTNFTDFQDTLLFFTKALGRKSHTSVLRGYQYSSATLFSLSVAEGLAVDVNGFPLHKSSTTSGIAVAAPSVSQGRNSLIVARQKLTDNTPIAEPENPSNTVYLNTQYECDIVCIDGTLGGAYPAKLTGDVILFGLVIPANVSAIDPSYVDYSVTEYPFKNSDVAKYFQKFHAVVGVGPYSTHADLNAVMADANISNIKEILVAESLTINTVQTIDQNNKRIYFAPGVTLTKGTAASGVVVSATGVDLDRGRFSGFNGGSDVAVGYENGADNGSVFGTRFNNCTNTIVDLTSGGVATSMTINE